MAEFAWRIPARFVAGVNLILCSFWIITIVLLTIFLIHHGPDAFSKEIEDGDDLTVFSGILSYPWVLFVVSTVGFILHLYVSLNLMTATNRGIEPQKAVRLMKNWDLSYSAPVVILLQIVYKLGATKQIDWALVTCAAIVTVFILIVRQYRKELHKSESPISIKDLEKA